MDGDYRISDFCDVLERPRDNLLPLASGTTDVATKRPGKMIRSREQCVTHVSNIG